MLEPVKPFTTAGKPVFSGAASMNARQRGRCRSSLGSPFADAFRLAVAPDVFGQDELVPLVNQVADGLADEVVWRSRTPSGRGCEGCPNGS
jgi:hypothetical protein